MVNKLAESGNKVSGLCPLYGHNEKTPSWFGWLDKNRWKCFGCNRYGDQIDLVAQALNMTLADTIKMLATDLGISQDQSTESRQAAKRAIRQRKREKQRQEFKQDIIKSEYSRLCEMEQRVYHIISDEILIENNLNKPEVIAALQNQAHLEYFINEWLEATDNERFQLALIAREVF